jgi:hypothetical protein
MDDQDILQRIHRLADEERGLEEAHVGEGLSGEERDRLQALQVSLDQCWDLLRQRAARRNAGLDPDAAAVRPASVVEGYQQ